MSRRISDIMVFIAITLAFLAILSSMSHAYMVSAQNTTSNANNMTIQPLYCNPPMYTCLLEDRVYFDAPWRVSPNTQLTVYGIINWEYYNIKRIVLYDDINGNIVAERSFGDGLAINASKTPHIVNLSIDTSTLSRINNRARLRMIFTTSLLGIAYNETEGPIEIMLSNDTLPVLTNWYYGDTHYHSSYTRNLVEFGAPLPATMNAMKAIGLDWVTVTDHSFSMKTDEWWNSFKDECNSYSNCLIGEEISCDNDGALDYNHYLGYNLTDRIYSGEFPDNGTSPLPCTDIVNGVNAQKGGFGYVAHPFYREPLYIGPDLFYRNIWQNYSLPFIGLQIWNHEDKINELEQGLVKWRELLLSGRKVFIEGGSDAHGDFNRDEYGSEGTGFGKVRTACFARNFTKDNIFTALKNGNCMMTDGPIVVFTANKHIIGESFNVSEGDTIQLNISWNSTNEFGNVTEILLIRGEISGTEINETVLAPNNLSGNFIRTSTPNNTYYRIEARSIDSEGVIRRAYTNPIWVYAEPLPEVEKIPMDETELALVAQFENKYEYSLDNIYFDGEPTLSCDITELRKNLNLHDSWQSVKCEKMILNGTRLMWVGFNNTETNEKRIILQIGNVLQFANATYTEYRHAWKGWVWWVPATGSYINYNWVANKNEKIIFEINEIHNSNSVNNWGGGSGDFGTYLIHGFRKYGGNTTIYYTYWHRVPARQYNINNVYLLFDNKTAIPITEGSIMNTDGVLRKKSFNHDASSFGFGADGAYIYGYSTGWQLLSGSGFDQTNRSIFSISQTNSIISCHADIDCNDGDLFTKDICTNAGTTDSKCEHSPQEPEEIKKPYTEMDADEVSKAIDFKAKHNASLSELYFDGWKNTTCNTAGILETLKLNNSWSVIRCRKFLINNSLVMFAGLNNPITGRQYIAYQLGPLLLDDYAIYKIYQEDFQHPYTYYPKSWKAVYNNTPRFEVYDFGRKECSYDFYNSWCTYIIPYATYIIHGFRIDENHNTAMFYSFKGGSINPENNMNIKISFDNYARFSLENETSSNYNGEAIYETKTFGYRALYGWTLGTRSINYPVTNTTIFPPYRANELIVGLESPAHLRAMDSTGRITGYVNGTYITEIPNSEILETEHEKYLLPANETYRFFVEGYTDGNYSLKITRANGENSSIIYFKNISATNETSDSFEIDESGEMNIKTNDSEKNIIVALDGIDGPSEDIEFSAAKNKSVSIYISNWSALNESTTITENINYAPEIISIQPNNGSSFGKWQNITLGVYATDRNNDSLEYRILFDSIELSQANETTYILNETGAHTINFSASDGMNTVSEEIQIYVIAPPDVTIIRPENRTYNKSNISISAVFEELVDTAWISVDGAPGQNYTKNTTAIYLNLTLSDGIHLIRAYANNSIGIENYSEVFFTVNTTALTPPAKGNNGKHCGKYKTHGKRDKAERNEEKEFCKWLKPKNEKDRNNEEDENDELENDSEDEE